MIVEHTYRSLQFHRPFRRTSKAFAFYVTHRAASHYVFLSAAFTTRSNETLEFDRATNDEGYAFRHLFAKWVDIGFGVAPRITAVSRITYPRYFISLFWISTRRMRQKSLQEKNCLCESNTATGKQLREKVIDYDVERNTLLCYEMELYLTFI